jgi:hypothetical protein
LPPIKICAFSCSNGPIMHHFRGRMDRHLRGISSISRNETALQVHFCNAAMCP